MSQLYAQLASRPDPWLIGRTSAGLCTLQTACPLTVTYSGGGAADTIAAGSAATVYGGSATGFDASADVWVVLTVQGSGALQVVKEADLATVTGAWAGLARIAQHAAEPYQPQAYLGAGGLGSTTSTTYTYDAVLDATTRALSLWNGTSNDAPPAGWQTSGFDDSAWPLAVTSHEESLGDISPWPPAAVLWSTTIAHSDAIVCRAHFTPPAGTISTAVLDVFADLVPGAYVNGTLVGSDAVVESTRTFTIPPSVLLGGADNVLALDALNYANVGDIGGNLAYRVTITYAGSGRTEGDILYFHSGVWTDLPSGGSGTVLTSDGTDPAWAAPATSGTVTSVQVAVPAPLSASGGPLTSSGTITLAWASGQTANRVLASPNGSSGAVSLRALVGNDIPVDASTIISSAGTIKGNYQAGSGVSISGNTISATGSGGSVTSVALSLPSSVFSLTGSPITTSGTLGVSLQSQSPHTFWGGPASGSAAAPTFRALQSSDLPAAAGAGGKIHAHGHFI